MPAGSLLFIDSTMDVRLLFYNASKKLMVDFETSTQLRPIWEGRGSFREDAFIQFLAGPSAPKNIRLAAGKSCWLRISPVVSWTLFCMTSRIAPQFLQAESHGAFPIEAVYGVSQRKCRSTWRAGN